MRGKISNYVNYLDAHIRCMSLDMKKVSIGEIKFEIPSTSAQYILDLTNDAKEILKIEPNVIQADDDYVIVGDLHGHLPDLYRILIQFDLPPKTKYIFLGDLVDRGQFSVETVCLVLTLKVLYHKSVLIIRGNHEFQQTTKENGLLSEILSSYQSVTTYQALSECFSFIPLACVIGGEILCVHAGLSPGLNTIEQISSIDRPINNYDDPIVCGLVWSDPREDVTTFLPSPRGTGFLFGPTITRTFLQKNHLKVIVRGHECAVSGVHAGLDEMVVTVFSASSYCGNIDNKCGVLEVRGKKLIPRIFTPFHYVTRAMSVVSGQDDESVTTAPLFMRNSRHTGPMSHQRPLPGVGGLPALFAGRPRARSRDINEIKLQKKMPSLPLYL